MTYEVIWWLIWWPTIWFWNYHERLSYKLLMRLVPKMGSKWNRQSVLCGILIDGNQYPRTGSAEILMVLFLLLPLLLFLLLLIIFKWLPTDWNKHIHISTKISSSNSVSFVGAGAGAGGGAGGGAYAWLWEVFCSYYPKSKSGSAKCPYE